MSIKIFTEALRSYYAGHRKQFVFKYCESPGLQQNLIDETHLYVHIPFCQHCCPYCPYNKVEWNREKVNRYFQALQQEIAMYHEIVGKMKILSVYFGGGSPALSPEDLRTVISDISERFEIVGDVCIEINPRECDKQRLHLLKESGVSLLSIGIQSFQDRNLHLIGRDYEGKLAEKALENAVEHFDNVNIDLMFALEKEDLHLLENDLKQALRHQVKQITVYPLFTFPYSSIGKYRKIKKVKMPNLFQRRKQYYFIYDFLTSHGYERVSVWSFMKGQGKKYSSVTRDGYVGFGAGAGSHLPWGFYLNTFSIEGYTQRILENKLPTALEFKLNESLNNLFWLYWRFYDTRIPKKAFEERFSSEKKIKKLIQKLVLTGMIEETEEEYVLTKKGSFWLHLAQNYFSLNYINKIWSIAMKEAFPSEIYF